MLVVFEGHNKFVADNLSCFLVNSGIDCRVHHFKNKTELEKALQFSKSTNNKIIVIGCPTLAMLMPLLEESFYKIPLENITVWNLDPVPIVYRLLYKFRSVNLIHSSMLDAFLWNKIFHENSKYTNGLYDICNLPKLINCTFETFKSNEVAFPINLFWGGHTLESFLHEIKEAKDLKLERYSRELNEIVSVPWQQSLIDYNMDPLNIRHQRGTLLLYNLYSRKQLAKLYSDLNSKKIKTQQNTSKDKLSYTPDSITRRMNKRDQSNKNFSKSEYVLSTSYTSFFHDRTVRAIFAGALVLEDQFSGFGSEFEKHGIEVISHSKKGASIDAQIFNQEYGERKKLFEKQLNCVKEVLKRSNFSVFLNIN